MPTCAYRCDTCGERFEQQERIAEHEKATAKCPKCGSEKVVAAYSAFYVKTVEEELTG